jgi:hypothetical protein
MHIFEEKGKPFGHILAEIRVLKRVVFIVSAYYLG